MTKPTHFLSLRLNSTKFSGFFDHIASAHPTMTKHLVPPQSVHLTLLVLSIPPHSLPRALESMRFAAENLIPKWFPKKLPADVFATSQELTEMRSSNLHLRGVGVFGNGKVVWAQVADVEDFFAIKKRDLAGLAADLKNLFGPDGFVAARYDFTPHVTLMKVGGSKSNKNGKRGNQWIDRLDDRIDARIYLPFSQQDFGVHHITEIELSEMGPMDVDGYYHCVCKVDW